VNLSTSARNTGWSDSSGGFGIAALRTAFRSASSFSRSWLQLASYGEWLDPQTPEARLIPHLKPYPADEMTVTEVGPAVNSPKNDGPECLEAA
jgi:hypothetical protein